MNLLTIPMDEVVSVTTDPVRGAGWYGPTTGLHSVSIRALNFQGRLSIQATLAVNPQTADWFSVFPDAAAYWQYPRLSYVPPYATFTGETSTTGFNFNYNAVWVRAIIDRSYLMPVSYLTSPLHIQYLGVIDNILLNY